MSHKLEMGQAAVEITFTEITREISPVVAASLSRLACKAEAALLPENQPAVLPQESPAFNSAI